ncbi:MAG: ABC transporter ATP-binding protein [Symploca sp. SIO1C2]|nr:ABC transporter ATP-binding protein [Symploca sp. SIO1C2]
MNSKIAEYGDKEIEFQGKYHRSVFRLIIWSWMRWPMRSIGIILLSILGRLAFIGNTVIVGYWADSLCDNKVYCQGVPNFASSWDNNDYILALLIFTALSFLFTGFFQSLMSVTGLKACEKIINETMYRVSRAPAAFFDKNPVGRVFSRFSTDFSQLTTSMGLHLSNITGNFVEMLLMLIFAGLTSLWFLPLFLTAGILSAVTYNMNKMSIRNERRNTVSEQAPSISHFAATVQGANSIRSYQKEEKFLDKFGELIQKYFLKKCTAELYFQFYSYQLNLITALWIFGCGVLGVYLIEQHLVSLGEVGIILGFVSMISSLFQRFFTLISSLENGLASAERLNDYVRMPIEPNSLLTPKSEFDSGHQKEQESLQMSLSDQPFPLLTIKHLDFSYGEDLPLALKDINLEAKPGESIGIIGRTGSGKSSLFKVLLGYYGFQKGLVTIGGKQLGLCGQEKPDNYLGLKEWRSQFSYISQSPPIFRGPLRENLTIRSQEDRKVADKKMLQTLEKVGLEKWFQGLPQGLDTPIEEGGTNLSVGQKQLLVIARCLLRKAPILLIDEATSSVDPYSEEKFVKTANQLLKHKTRLVIAHRLSTLTDCDRVLWLDGGSIRMEGRPEEVIPVFTAHAGTLENKLI